MSRNASQFLSCSDTEGSRLNVGLPEPTEDRGRVDDDVISLEELGAWLGEDVAGQLASPRVGRYGPSELCIKCREVGGVEEVE